MDFRILGPLEVRAGGRRVQLRGPRQERLLAALLLDADRVVPLGRLAEVVWDTGPPATAGRQVQNLVAQLRRILVAAGAPEAIIGTERSGYAIRAPADELDATRFEALVEKARAARAGDAVAAATAYRSALGLWRGPALAGIDSRLLESDATRWNEERLAVWEECLACELDLGRHAELAGELTTLAERHPFRERFTQLLMLALYHCGRQADALRAYRRLRDRLAEELGLDPGDEVRLLNEAMLRRDPSLDSPLRPATDAPAAPAAGTETPAQLPAVVADFTGRHDDLTALHELAGAGEADTMTLVVIAGPAGVGKTALATRWAHRIADRFPHGQLYLNLQGFGPQQPVEPAAALANLLRALGVEDTQVPSEPAAAAAMYRTLLAGRRVLVVLDNAATAEQIRPLLPGGQGCLVLVTSRSRLAGLVAGDGARRHMLAPLAPHDATALLAKMAGAGRVAAEPDAAAELAALCGHLPLALRIAAANMADAPARAIAEHAADLRANRLDTLAVAEDDQTAVRVAFHRSYRGLPPQTQRLFRLLGLVPVADFSVNAVAALAGINATDALGLLNRLSDLNLVQERPQRRYTLHDLLRLYAHEQAHHEEAEPARRLAMRRLLDWYLGITDAANRVVTPHRDLVVLGHQVDDLPFAPTHLDVVNYLEDEIPNFPAMVRYAAENGHDVAAWQLAYLQGGFFEQRRFLPEFVECCQLGLAAARRAGDLTAQGMMHNLLGIVRVISRRFDEAIDHLVQAAGLFHAAGDVRREAGTYNNVGLAHSNQHRYPEAIHWWRRAVAVHEAHGHLNELATVLGNLAQDYRHQGLLDESFDCATRAIAIWRKLEDPRCEGIAVYALAKSHSSAGNHDAAIDAFVDAIGLLRKTGERPHEADALGFLGDVQIQAGNTTAALASYREAREIQRELGNPHEEAAMLARMAQALLRRDDLDAASAHLDDSQALRDRVPDTYEQGRLDHCRADLAHRRGDLAEARECWQRALASYEQVQAPEADEVRRSLAGAVAG